MRAVILLVLSIGLLEVRGINDVLRRTQPLYGLSTMVEDIENNTCFKHLNLLRVAVDEGKVWAIKAMDASGRPGQGFIYGNNIWIGSHAQCKYISNTGQLNVNHKKVKHLTTSYDYPPYPTDFAIVYFRHNNTLQLHLQKPLEWNIQLGLCIPKSCSADEILNLTKTYIENRYLEVQQLYNLHMEVFEARKLLDDSTWYYKLPKTIAFNVLLILILLLTIMGTIYDARRKKSLKNNLNGHSLSCVEETNKFAIIDLVTEEKLKQSTFGEVLQCFSFTANSKNLMKTKLSPDSVRCIHGLRFLSMIWILALHSPLFALDFEINAPLVYWKFENIMFAPLTNGTFSVDSYLFISGFLVGYLYYKRKNPHLKSDKPVNYLLKIREFGESLINRLCRLTPSYMVTLLFANVVYTYHRKSSSLTPWERLDLLCDKYWWRNILYINNLFPRSEMCMSWSWYLAVDTQLFTVSLVLLILSTISFKTSANAVVLILLTSTIVTAWKCYAIGYIMTLDEQMNQLDALYDLPWNRIGPYLVGVVTAYLLKIKLQDKLVLTKKTRLFLWTIFPLLNICILYTRDLSMELSAVYVATSRTLWGVGIAWVLVACCTGNAKTLQKLLSFKGFIPLSRMTYSVYLLNPVIIAMIYLSGESGVEISVATVFLIVAGITLLNFYMAYLFSVMVESPFILLTKMVQKKFSPNSSQSEP